ncbi:MULTISPECIES: response regulator [unclassified Haladaptatus]|uniref:response regulator n=1 Tax=unclassified Haladaptatus TaxID=2622732 RepID=UPI00209C4578|nr:MULTISPECIES: response regulator [unclassified Haladaptatus]MCO8246276.1 response regulator [Haladaptatus sp. AB643]MCO8255178.1 response regulator [Haladaptatus sp. AB618]
MTDASLVLVLSKNERNQSLLTDLVNEEGCETRPVSTVEEFDNVLRGEDSITIAVLDTEGYTADLWKRCDYLNERDIPTVVLTPETPPHVRREAISRGVRSILEKPVDTADLRATIRGMLTTT